MPHKTIISGLFTIVLLLIGYVWSGLDKRLDSIEEKHRLLVNEYLATRETVNKHSGILQHHP